MAVIVGKTRPCESALIARVERSFELRTRVSQADPVPASVSRVGRDRREQRARAARS